MAAILLRIRTWWETADRTQKVVTIFGSLLLVTIIAGTLFFASRPKMEVLYRELSPADQASVVDELTKAGIPVEYDRSGLVSVPGQKLAEAQAKLATANKMPTSGQLSNKDLSSITMMSLPEVERAQRKAIAEGVLATSIEKMDGVQGATVHLSLGEQSPFMKNESQASASVLITESANNPIDSGLANAVKNLIVHSVDKLDAKNITIVTNTGRTLFDGGSEAGGQGLASARIQAESNEAKKRERSLQQRLDAILGPGNAIVSVPVLEMNFDERTVEQETKSPTEGPVVVDTANETMTAGSQTGTTPAGVASNTPDLANAASQDSKSQNYMNKNESKTYDVNTTRTNTRKATGNLTKLAYNVIVNSDKVKDIVPIEEAVTAELGPLAKDSENFTAKVTQMAFDKTMQAQMEKTTAATASAQQKQQILSMLPIAALLLVGFMVVKAIGKASKAQNVMVAAMPGGQIVTLGTGPSDSATGQRLRTESEDSEDGENALSLSEGESTTTLLPGQQTQSIVRGSSTDFIMETTPEQQMVIAGIPDKLHVPLEQLRRFSVDKPEKVALLLKSWLMEDVR